MLGTSLPRKDATNTQTGQGWLAGTRDNETHPQSRVWLGWSGGHTWAPVLGSQLPAPTERLQHSLVTWGGSAPLWVVVPGVPPASVLGPPFSVPPCALEHWS